MKEVYNGGLLTLLLLLMSCSGGKSKQEEEKRIPVEIVKVSKSVPSDVRVYIGTVEEELASSLSFKVAGNVELVCVGEGQRVDKGQLLAVLDKATLENTYNASAASLRQATDAYDRMKILYDNKSLPDIKWVEMESKLEQAESAERIARRNLDDCKLYAPFAGVIGKRTVEIGENVLPGQSVFSLLQIGKVKVRIAVPENEIATLDNRKAAITVAALGGQSFRGAVTEKGITAHPVSHTYEAKITLGNPSFSLLPGMVCKVYLSGDGSDTRIALPNNAVQIAPDGSRFVWCVAGGRAEQVEVRTGRLTEHGLLIEEGLQEGDSVVTGGYQKVSDGMKVSAL